MGLIYILGFLVFLLVVSEFVLCPLIPITIISTLYISYEALLALAIVFQSILIHLGLGILPLLEWHLIQSKHTSNCVLFLIIFR